MKVYGVVYLLWNKVNGKRYVGQTVQPLKERMRKHRYGNLYIDKAIDKYGLENFRYGVIKTCATKAELDEAEKHFIVVLHSKAPYGYNLTDGGEGTVGYIPTPNIVREFLRHDSAKIIRITANRFQMKRARKFLRRIVLTARSKIWCAKWTPGR